MNSAAGSKPTKVYKTTNDLDREDFRSLYEAFHSPVAELDCGKKCAPLNPSGKPFCCDISHVVAAAYKSEWKYLKQSTYLWHTGREMDAEILTLVKCNV